MGARKGEQIWHPHLFGGENCSLWIDSGCIGAYGGARKREIKGVLEKEVEVGGCAFSSGYKPGSERGVGIRRGCQK